MVLVDWAGLGAGDADRVVVLNGSRLIGVDLRRVDGRIGFDEGVVSLDGQYDRSATAGNDCPNWPYHRACDGWLRGGCGASADIAEARRDWICDDGIGGAGVADVLVGDGEGDMSARRDDDQVGIFLDRRLRAGGALM
jgi:hypothetical protein